MSDRLIGYSVFLFILLLSACKSPPSPIVTKSEYITTFSGEAMTMKYKIIVGHPLENTSSQQISDLIMETFNEVDRIYNKWNPNSELSQLNKQKADIKTPLSPALHRLLKETDAIVLLSEGRFDPTIEPLQQLWYKHAQNGSIPNDAEIDAIAPAIGWNNIHFDESGFHKDHDLTQMDLGGIAKGLCIDLFIERLKDLSYRNCYVEWGGEIRASGQHPEGRPWTIFISALSNENPDEAIDTLYLNDHAIATSGDYLQNWSIKLPDENGKHSIVTYFHIFDPKTLKPLEASHESIASASILAESCAMADGIATAVMLFGNVAEAEEWLQRVQKQFPGISYWLSSRKIMKNQRYTL